MSTLPVGLMTVRFDGTVADYLPAGEGAPPASEVVGKRLFGQVLDATQTAELHERFERFRRSAPGESSASVRLEMKHGLAREKALFGLIRSPVPDTVLVSVARLGHPDLPLTSRLRQDSIHGTLTDTSGFRVVVANTDLWRALQVTLARLDGGRGGEVLLRLGSVWGLAHAVRVESFVQRKTLRTLRELELETALEYLSASLAVVGLGRFEADLSNRHVGVVVVDHSDSPFPELLPSSGMCCEVIAGFHAGLFSYLSGRNLAGWELTCVGKGARMCRFLIGTEERLRALRRGGGKGDRELLGRLAEAGS